VPKPVDIHAVFINATKPQWKDPNIMKAIYYAVDRREINNTILNGTGRVLNNPPGFNQDYSDVDQYPFDPAKAKQLLDAAKFPYDDPFVISYQSTQAVWSRVFPVVQTYLQAVGIQAELKAQDDTAWLNDITENFDSWDLSIHTGGFEGLGPSISSIYYVCKGFFVDTLGYDKDIFCKVEDLFTQARREPDAAKREDLYHQIAVILNGYPMREMWWSFPEIIVLNKKFNGLKPYAQTQRVLSNIEEWSLN
jgi:peptide/nickel transport system substrate-binding protein